MLFQFCPNAEETGNEELERHHMEPGDSDTWFRLHDWGRVHLFHGQNDFFFLSSLFFIPSITISDYVGEAGEGGGGGAG